jgi:transcriptional regulator with XRE-family HTH domain
VDGPARAGNGSEGKGSPIASLGQDALFHEALGRAIKVLRTEHGLTRRELAEDAEVSYPYLSEIENGKKRPSSRALLAISDALGLRPHEVLETAERLGTRAVPPIQGGPGARSVETTVAGAAEGPRSGGREQLLELVDELSDEDVGRILDLARRLAP